MLRRACRARGDREYGSARAPWWRVAVSDRLARLGGVVIGVPDPPSTGSFLRECIGFAVSADGERITASCAGDYGPRGQVAIDLRVAPELQLLEITWEVSDAYDLDALARRLAEREMHASRSEMGISFQDVAGNPLACVRSKSREHASPADDPLRPRRLGHVNLRAPDPPAAAAFYTEVLGMRLSEQIGEDLYFLRVATEHHNVGLRGGERAGLHHLGLEIDGWNLYQPILDRLVRAPLDQRQSGDGGANAPTHGSARPYRIGVTKAVGIGDAEWLPA